MAHSDNLNEQRLPPFVREQMTDKQLQKWLEDDLLLARVSNTDGRRENYLWHAALVELELLARGSSAAPIGGQP